MQNRKSQNEQVLDYIREFGSITQLEALADLGCMRLAPRVSELRKAGYPVKSERVPVKNRYGQTCYISRYTLDRPREVLTL